MKIVCAWCSKEIETAQGYSGREMKNKISHGICYPCANKLHHKIGIKLVKFLEDISAPVIIVSDTGKIKNANKIAQELLNKGLSDIEDLDGGVVFECAYAKLPEGCGKTTHCTGCTNRNTVMDTLETGTSHCNEPAYLNLGDPENPQKIDMLISTEKVDDIVLLRVDRLGNNELTKKLN